MVFFIAPATSSRINQEFRGKNLLPPAEKFVEEIPDALLFPYSRFKPSIETWLRGCQRRTHELNKKENVSDFRFMGRKSRARAYIHLPIFES
jgi:hypothetical protein